MTYVFFPRDFELNGVCMEVCVEETFTCITNCDPTDSECISTCLRAETTCVNGMFKLMNYDQRTAFKNVHVVLTVMPDVKDVKIQFVNAR